MEDNEFFDLTQLDGPLTADAILKTLQHRFEHNLLQCWVGSVLLSMCGTVTSATLIPSVQRIISLALDELIYSKRPQCIVLTGESGSGKSHLCEKLMVEILKREKVTALWTKELFKNVVTSMVVLKALGCAQTVKNKDSSRIGRMFEVLYTGRNITRIKLHCFHLDQTRLVSPTRSELNYQIFYQILAGLSTDERAKLHVQGYQWKNLHYLSQASEPQDHETRQKALFEAWKSSLAKLGIPLNDVLRVLVAVMLLGNVSFYESKEKELGVQGSEELAAVAALLGMRSLVLQRGLSFRTHLSNRGQVSQAPCSAAAANHARDVLAKALYIRTVSAIIRRINSLFKPTSQVTSPVSPAPLGSPSSRNVISPPTALSSGNRLSQVTPPLVTQDLISNTSSLHVIDLFGFECNESNSMEQLCINWSEECLQEHFIKSVFSSVLEDCSEEGVESLVEPIVFDPAPCIELIGNEHDGMLQLINKETLSPRVQSQDICVRLRDKFKAHPSYSGIKGSASTFTIQHFAGEVVYDVYSLLNANADTIADDVVALFNEKDCKFGFAVHLFSHELNRDLSRDHVAPGFPQGQMCRITPIRYIYGQTELKGPTTFVQDFQASMQHVLSTLPVSTSHFIRCIQTSPTHTTTAQFNRAHVSQQISNLVVLETVDMLSNNYCYRYTFDEFLTRYRSLLKQDHGLVRAVDKCKTIMEELQEQSSLDDPMEDDCWTVGINKMFLTQEAYMKLETTHSTLRRTAAVKLQSHVRRYLTIKRTPQSGTATPPQSYQEYPVTQPNGEASLPGCRNYTVVGNVKVGFPQWRIMKSNYPEKSPLLTAGLTVFVTGRSHQRGFLIVDYNQQQIHVPHQFTELKVVM